MVATIGAGLRWEESPARHGVTLRTHGEGPPIVLFPGFDGVGDGCLHLLFPLLDRLVYGGFPHRLIVVDYSGEEHDDLDGFVATCGALLADALGDEEPVVVGQSTGAVIAARWLARPGVRASRLLLLSPFTRLRPGRLWLGRLVFRIMPQRLFPRVAPRFALWLLGPVHDNPQHPVFEAQAKIARDTWGRRAAWMAGRDFGVDFAAVSLPMRAWFGRDDRLIDLPREMKAFGAMAQMTSPPKVIDGAGHLPLATMHAERVRRELIVELLPTGAAAPPPMIGARS